MQEHIGKKFHQAGDLLAWTAVGIWTGRPAGVLLQLRSEFGETRFIGSLDGWTEVPRTTSVHHYQQNTEAAPVAIAAQAESWLENQKRYWGAYGVTLDDEVAPCPAPSKPLSLSEFDRIVREVVAKRAPKASVLTDGNQVRLDAWIRCGGLEEHVTAMNDRHMASNHAEAAAKVAVDKLVRRLGEREVGL